MKNKILKSIIAGTCVMSMLISSSASAFAAGVEEVTEYITSLDDNTDTTDIDFKPIVVSDDENGKVTYMGDGYFEKEYYNHDTGKMENEVYFDESGIEKYEGNNEDVPNTDESDGVISSDAPISFFSANDFFDISLLSTGVNSMMIDKDGDGEDDSTVFYGDCTGDGSSYVEGAHYQDGDKVEWWLDSDGTLTFKGTGCIKDYGKQKNARPPWYGGIQIPYDVKNIIIGEGIRYIGSDAFSGLDKIETVTYPETSLIDIGSSAFENSSIREFNIPDTVKYIQMYAFRDCTKLLYEDYDVPEENRKTLHLPNSLVSLSSGAFQGSYCIHKVEFPEGLTKIPDSCFKGCSALGKQYDEEAYVFPDTITTIGSSAFANTGFKNVIIPANTTLGNAIFMGSALKKVEFENGVTEVPNSMFKECDALENVKMVDSIESIGSEAFRACTKLPYVEIPQNVTEIGNDAFSYCYNLEELNIPAKVELIKGNPAVFSFRLKNINVDPENDYYESNNGVLFTKGLEDLIYYPIWGKEETEYTIPNGTKNILQSAFAKNTLTGSEKYETPPETHLTTVHFPETVKTIGKEAFYGLESLTTVTLNNGLESIGEKAFSYTGLESITIPETVNKMLSGTFLNCKCLTTAELSSNLTTISQDTFSGCVHLGEVIVPEGITYIGSYAFASCEELSSIALPSTLETIDVCGFMNCKNLKTIELPKSLKEISVKGLPFGTLETITVNEENTTYRVDNDVALINNDTKTLVGYLTQNKQTIYTVPEDVEVIGKYAFYNASYLQSINLSNITAIERSAFEGASKIHFTLPEGLKSIGAWAFYNIGVVSNLKIPASVISIGQKAFAQSSSGKGVSGVLTFESQEEPNDSRKLVFEINQFSGTDESISKAFDKSSLRSIDFGNRIIVFNGYEFSNSPLLMSVDMSKASVATIAVSTFDGCPYLNDVQFSPSIQNICNRAFAGSTQLAQITIPWSIRGISTNAFLGTRLQKIVIRRFKLPYIVENGDSNTEGAEVIYANAYYPQTAYNYTGAMPKPTVTLDGESLIENVDYTIEYGELDEENQMEATIRGVPGRVGGYAVATFKLIPDSITRATYDPLPDVTYTGDPFKPKPVLTYKFFENGPGQLVEGEDYTLSWESNVNAGTGKVIVRGINRFSGEMSIPFTINKRSITEARITQIPAQDYTGNPITPNPTLTYNGHKLLQSADYTLSYSDNTTDIGTVTITITGIGNFEGTVNTTFEIEPSGIEGVAVHHIPDQEYNGKPQEPDLTITYKGRTLEEDTDYTLDYSNNVDVGTATVTITGVENSGFTGTTEANFNIIACPISRAAIETPDNVTYTGSEITPGLTITYNGMTLEQNVDYTLGYSENVNAGMAEIIVTGIGNYSGTRSTNFGIDPCEISKADISEIDEQMYTGEVITPKPTLSFNGKTLVQGVDYTLYYSENRDIGTATITITGNGNFTGVTTTTFQIIASDIKDVIVLNIPDQLYTGKQITPDPTIMFNGRLLAKDYDYTLSYENNVDVGTATVTITSVEESDFVGTATKTFEIVPRPIADAAITLPKHETYTGDPITPHLTIEFEGMSLVVGKDYNISYDSNTNVGMAEIVIEGINNFEGSRHTVFTIVPRNIFEADITEIPPQHYTGDALTPEPTISYRGKPLTKNVDYVLMYANNVREGTATVTVRGVGNFTDIATTTFKIESSGVDGVVVLGIPDQVYTGKPITPEPTISYRGKTLTKDEDYTLDYENNINVGRATVKITGIAGSGFDGTTTVSFNITHKPIADAAIKLPEHHVYTGEPIQPEMEVTLEDLTLVKDKDYTVDYDDNTRVGTAEVVITGVGNFAGTRHTVFAIMPCDIEDTDIDDIPAQDYTGYHITPDPHISYNGQDLIFGRDYTLKYEDNLEVGTATVTIAGNGNFTGTVDKTFEISEMDIDYVDIAPIPSQTYTGYEITPEMSITFHGRTLVKGLDYTVEFENNKDVGTATVIITGIPEAGVKGTKETEFDITPAQISSAKVSSVPKHETYTGDPYTPEPTLVFNGIELVKDVDYTLDYSNNVDAGEVVITITGMGNFEGTMTETFVIEAVLITNVEVTAIPAETYSGEEITPEPTVTYEGNELTMGEDYVLEYDNNLNAGTAMVIIRGIGNYTGTTNRVFTINSQLISNTDMSIEDVEFTGYPQDGHLALTYGDNTLVKDKDYTASFINNINVGTATAIITGVGNFAGNLTSGFDILQRLITLKNIKAEPIPTQAYTGYEVTPKPVIWYGDFLLEEDKDYTLEYRNNVNVGTASVDVTFMGNYTGKITLDFEIQKYRVTASNNGGYIDGAKTEYVDDNNINVTLPDGVVFDYDDRVHVTVTDMDGNPVEGVTVHVTDSNGTVEQDTTDEQGDASVPPQKTDTTDKNGQGEIIITDDDGNVTGRYTVTVSDESGPVKDAFLSLTNDGNLSVTMPDGKVVGASNRVTVSVKDENGEGVADLTVTVSDTAETPSTFSGKTSNTGSVTLPPKSSVSSGGGGGGSSGGGGGGGSSSGVLTPSATVTDDTNQELTVEEEKSKTGDYTITLPESENLEDGKEYTVTLPGKKEGVKVTLKDKFGNEVSGITDKGGKVVLKYKKTAIEPTEPTDTVEHSAYIYGDDYGLFRPDNMMTRAEAATIFAQNISQRLDEDISDNNSQFADVLPGTWYNKYIAYLEGYDIITGYEDGLFYPETPITRTEFVTMCKKYYELYDTVEEFNENIFPDVPDTHWGVAYIKDSVGMGWISGYEDGTFKPDNFITRSEVVAIINRVLGRSTDREYINSNIEAVAQFTDVPTTHWAYYDILEACNSHTCSNESTGEVWVKVQ